MRHFLSVSVLALSLAMAAPVHADTWFRLNMAPIVFAGTGQDGDPPGGGVNDSIAIVVADKVDQRVYGHLSVGVTVSGIDASYTVSVADLPAGATWNTDGQVYGAGTISWPSAIQGTYRPTVEVRDAGGALIASSEIELVVHPQMTATVPQTSYEVEVGGVLSIAPTVGNAIGAIQWGATPAELPAWLTLEAATGAIEVDTAKVNTLSDITLTAVDQADMASASTLPFSITVNGAVTDYWVATLGGPQADAGQGVAAGSDGSIYVVGYTRSAGAGGSDLLLTKYTPTGEISWKKTLGGSATDHGYSVAAGADGSVYVSGYTQSAGAGSDDMLVAKFTASGDVDWKNTLGIKGTETGNGLAIGPDGSVFVVGHTTSAGGGSADLLLVKYTSSGSIAWRKTLGRTAFDHGYGVATSSDGSVYVSGATRNPTTDSLDLLVAKYTASGVQSWIRALGGTGTSGGSGLTASSDGSVYVVGYTDSASAGVRDLLIVKYSALGDISWKKNARWS
jgi:uncharacterized delta-60 repeat protein